MFGHQVLVYTHTDDFVSSFSLHMMTCLRRRIKQSRKYFIRTYRMPSVVFATLFSVLIPEILLNATISYLI